ncbi:MAG: hypothetical protein V2A53_05000 [bacterium]
MLKDFFYLTFTVKLTVPENEGATCGITHFIPRINQVSKKGG